MTLARQYRWRGGLATTTLSAALLALSGILAQAENRQASPAWIDGLERAMVARSGRVLMIPADPEAGREAPLHAVFYAPLSAVWVLAEPDGTEVLASGSLHRGDVGRGFVTITWDIGTLTTLTEAPPIPKASGIHPLAEFHDRLLAYPLESPLPALGSVAGLPAGSRFTVTGIVETPADPAGAQKTAQDVTTGVTLWESLGNYLVITKPDGTRAMIGWREVDAALKGDQK